MQWNEIREWLAPRDAERDEAFRREIGRLARRSLYIIAAVEFGMPLVSILSGVLLDVEYFTERLRLAHLLPFLCSGGFRLSGRKSGQSGRIRAAVGVPARDRDSPGDDRAVPR